MSEKKNPSEKLQKVGLILGFGPKMTLKWGHGVESVKRLNKYLKTKLFTTIFQSCLAPQAKFLDI